MFETERDRFRYVRKKRSRTLTLTRPNIAPRSPRTMLTRVNRSGVYKNERLFRTAQSLPQRAFNSGVWGAGAAPTMALYTSRAFISHIPDSRFV